jgi:hypothetical protein
MVIRSFSIYILKLKEHSATGQTYTMLPRQAQVITINPSAAATTQKSPQYQEVFNIMQVK